MTRLTAKTSTIFIATAQKTRIYHSMDEVPPELRRRLQDSTHSLNSATILIADKRGREELVRALHSEPKDAPLTLPKSLQASCPGRSSRTGWSPSLRTWIELLLPVGIAGALWVFIGARF